jgi:hypothetical protein
MNTYVGKKAIVTLNDGEHCFKEGEIITFNYLDVNTGWFNFEGEDGNTQDLVEEEFKWLED